MKESTFKPADGYGLPTLERISKAIHFNSWMYETIKPYCNGNMLEIGSGIGNISKFFLEDGHELMLSDIRQEYCDYLKSKFSHMTTCKGILLMDLTDEHFEREFSHLFRSFDTVFALNVVEHIYDDNLAVQNARKLLKEGGICVILVPAYMWLYNSFDRTLGHYRRYNNATLNTLFTENGFTVIKVFYFNLIGIIGWFVSGKIIGRKIIPAGQVSLYNILVPFFKVIDKIVMKSAGLSVIAVGTKA